MLLLVLAAGLAFLIVELGRVAVDRAQARTAADAAALAAALLPVGLLEKFLGSKRKASMDDLATVIFSSGSTGAPKGAVYTHGNFAAQVAFDGIVRVDVFTNLQNFGIAQLVHAAGLVDANRVADRFGRGMADSGDIGEGDWNPLCSRDIDAGNTCHVSLSFSLRVRSSRPFFHNA